MRILLVAPGERALSALRDQCEGLTNVEVIGGSILDVACDAIVSSANSFGFMDGGIDAAYVEHFGPQLQDRVRMRILEEHGGELLVGAAEIVPTENDAIPFVIAAPTMRVPMVLPADTINPFLATRAALRLVTNGVFPSGKAIADHVRSVAFPAMGAGVGRVPVEVCARQMRAAIEQSRQRPSLPASWADASEEHQLLYTDQPTRLQY
jgi:O-acetyl-ADP-ribose deacetylase (regulator of RNase III)